MYLSFSSGFKARNTRPILSLFARTFNLLSLWNLPFTRHSSLVRLSTVLKITIIHDTCSFQQTF